MARRTQSLSARRLTKLPFDSLLFDAEQKQGILPLWFANKEDYGLIGSGDKVETIGLADVRNLSAWCFLHMYDRLDRGLLRLRLFRNPPPDSPHLRHPWG